MGMSARGARDRTRRRGAAALALAAVPAFFLAVEGALWLAGVPTLLAERDPFEGFSRAVRVFEADEARGVRATPPRATRHSFNYQEFSLEKPPGAFRVFVLGGSSAAGFPWGAHVAFSRVLEEALRASSPGRRIEVVNAGAMSYGTHRIRALAHEVLEYEPDVLVIYEGHNEFVEGRFHRELGARRYPADRIRAALHRWRLYSLMTRGILAARGPAASGHRASPEPSTAGELLGLDVAREDAAGTGREEKERVQDRFEENLRAIVGLARSRGVAVVLCTAACNLRDWPPNQSLFDKDRRPQDREEAQVLLKDAAELLRAGNAEEAVARLERARGRAPEYARVHFDLGRAYERLSRFEEAREAYERARDADAQPARVLGSFNEAVRGIAVETGAVLVDVESDLVSASPHGLLGFDLIDDYVHPNPRGHRLIARALWRAFHEAGLLGARRAADDSEFWNAVGEAPQGEDATIVGLAPAPGEGAPRASIWLYNQGLVLDQQGLHDRAIEKYRECLRLEPGYYVAAYNLGRLLHLSGRTPEALEAFRQALTAWPSHVKSMLGAGMSLVRLGRIAEAEEILSRAAGVDPNSADVRNALGHTRVLQGRPAEAIADFRGALLIDPEHPDARCNLGVALVRGGGLKEGIEHLRASQAVRHDDRRCRNALADALAADGRLEEAEGLYRASLRANPADRHAREGLARLAARRGAGR